MSLAKARTLPSSGVGCAKYGVINLVPQSMWMCVSGALSRTTSGGFSPSGKVVSLSSRDRGVVLSLSSIRMKTPGNPGILGWGAVAATSSMVLQMRCTCARFGAVWKFVVPRAFVGAVGKTGDGEGGNVGSP